MGSDSLWERAEVEKCWNIIHKLWGLINKEMLNTIICLSCGWEQRRREKEREMWESEVKLWRRRNGGGKCLRRTTCERKAAKEEIKPNHLRIRRMWNVFCHAAWLSESKSGWKASRWFSGDFRTFDISMSFAVTFNHQHQACQACERKKFSTTSMIQMHHRIVWNFLHSRCVTLRGFFNFCNPDVSLWEDFLLF